ncbi:ROK family protein [Microbacterium paludicola]|uniref:ROK family protein n=1 Tax=Microbacterium paludicola TaxID=300019 RepID=UPI001F1FB633|nr:ROK family protein [Microbacterium paludicola]
MSKRPGPPTTGAGIRIGIDIGGTKAEAVAVDDAGRIVARVRRSTEHGAEGVLRTARDAVALVAAEPGVGSITGAGVGIPGQILGGRVLNAVNLGLTEVDLGGDLERALGVPVHVENDVNAAALGAHATLVAERPAAADRPMAYLNLGTGIAAGLVLDGRLWGGSGGTAGEVGHISIDPAGPECPCGQRGCIETFAGGASVARRWGRGGELPIRDLFDAADAGDPDALALRDELARGVAAAVHVLTLTVDPAVIVIGGGVARLGDRLRGIVRSALVERSARSIFLTSLALPERIELLPPDSSAGALGAALAVPATHEPALGR